jgi:uncharacterized protein (TIGR03437 family)
VKSSQELIFLAMAMAGSLAAQSSVVAPNANANTAGNAAGALPTMAESIEFQQIVGSGQLPGYSINITGISFRAAPGTGPVNFTIGSLSLYLSTSPNYPNTTGGGKTLMSSTFANNAGPDKTLVFSGSNVTLQDSGCAGPAPCPFDLNIVFTTPFHYTASSGPLLLDFFETNDSATGGSLDQESFSAPGGSVASVVGAPGSATGTFSYQGNIVKLTYTTPAGDPTFSGIVNAASNLPPGFPNAGLAQGSIITIYGNNLGPAALTQPGVIPVPTTVAGTSVSISVAGTTTNAPILYTVASQIGAVVPSNTPVGNGQLTVTYSGNSASTPVTVVQSNFGIVTVNTSGSGPAVITFPNYSPVSATNSAKPGDELVLWGTGLGPLPAGQSDASGAVGGNLPTPIEVFVGGVQATVLYQGRTPTAVGLDQINFIVPPNAPMGCNVGVIVQTSTPATVSNAPTMAIAATDGAPCSDPTQTIPTSSLSLSSATVVFVNLEQNAALSVSGTPPNTMTSTTTTASATAGFLQFSNAQMTSQFSSINAEPSLGSCLTGTVAGPGGGGGPMATFLDGGSTVTLTPPSGPAIAMPSVGTGVYQNMNLTTIPSGMYNFSNGAGGASVGPLNFNFPVASQVIWTNEIAVATAVIDRTQPLTITWSGGDANGFVDITGQTQLGPAAAPTFTTYFDCAAPSSAGTFTIPPAILLSMVPGPSGYGSIQVSTETFPYTSTVSIPGFYGFVDNSAFQELAPVIFK